MGKTDIVDHIVNNVEGMTKKQATEAFDSVFECISGALEKEDRVQIPGFGSFSVSARAERQGRNPATGQPITIAASKNAKFKAGKALKDAVNN